jgi:molybdate transport system substrate-binding protein
VRRGLLALLLPCAGACARGADAVAPPTTVRVAAAASLRELFEATRPLFEASHPGCRLVASFAASSTLSRQIEAGAGFACLLSADAASVDRLGERLAPGTRVEFLRNALVVVARADLAAPPADAAALVDLHGPLALAGEAVPAGRYARRWLAARGLLARLQGRIAATDDVRAALALVEAGGADAAIVYATDARVARRARLAFRVPADEDPGVVDVAAAIAGGDALGAEYVRFLTTPAFQSEAVRLGFLPATP